MANLLHIVNGWAKTMGLMEVSKDERVMSIARLNLCAVCPQAKQSSLLKMLKGTAYNMATIYCKDCSCPVNEKSLVKNEKCPLGKWETIIINSTNN